MKRRMPILLGWLVLLSLVSYTLDLECVLARGSCAQSCQDASDDLCSEPSVHFGPPVYIPVRPFVLAVLRLENEAPPDFIEPSRLPDRSPVTLPVGMRAPPTV